VSGSVSSGVLVDVCLISETTWLISIKIILGILVKLVGKCNYRSHQFNRSPTLQQSEVEIYRLAYNIKRFIDLSNKIGKMYSLEYTVIPKGFFTPHHVGRSCTNVTLGHLLRLMPFLHQCHPKSCRLSTPAKTQQTDKQTGRHGRAYKVSFAHARAWRTPANW
jgi:hypothetical protein